MVFPLTIYHKIIRFEVRKIRGDSMNQLQKSSEKLNFFDENG